MFHMTDAQRAQWRRAFLAVIHEHWHTLRDDPDALEKAAMALGNPTSETT